MFRAPFAVLSVLLATLLLAEPMGAQKGTHKDPRIGYSIKPPKGWTEIPLGTGEEWIVAKFLSNKEERTYNKEEKVGYQMDRELVVLAFLTEMIERGDIEKEEDEGETAEVRYRWRAPFRDYEGFLKTSLSGYFIEEDEQKMVKGIPVRQLSIKSEGISGSAVRYITWIYTTDVGDVSVQIDCFDDNYKKHKSSMLKALKSFKLIERTESLDLSGNTGQFLSLLFLGEMDPSERKLRRQEQERQEWEDMKSSAPDAWKAKTYSGVNVLFNTDDKHAKKVAERVSASRKWLDETFPQIGTGEYTRTPIVRICSSEDERDSFMRGTGLGSSSQIVTFKDTRAGAASFEWYSISRETLDLWFTDRDRTLWVNIPFWLRYGLQRAVGRAEVKKKSLAFERDSLKQAYRSSKGEDSDFALRSFLTTNMTRGLDNDLTDAGDYHYRIQASALTLHLLEEKSKKGKEILPRYLKSLENILEQMDAEDSESEKTKKPSNEEEEEAYFQAIQEKAQERQVRLLEESMSLTFQDFEESDWLALERQIQRMFK